MDSKAAVLIIWKFLEENSGPELFVVLSDGRKILIKSEGEKRPELKLIKNDPEKD